jgi:hypothetical protein
LIESEVGQGTSITLFLPRATKISIAPRSAVYDAVPAATSARVLLVEDDDEVAAATAELLRDRGFQAVRVRAIARLPEEQRSVILLAGPLHHHSPSFTQFN